MQTQALFATPECLTVATVGRVDHIEWRLLVRVEAFSNYSKLFMANGKTLFVAKVLKKFEEQLSEEVFIRSHKTHLVNRMFVRTYIKGDQAFLLLANGDRIPVSRNRRKKMDQAFLEAA